MKARQTLSERFWPKVDRRGDDECWLWMGARTGVQSDTHRYGYIGRIPPSKYGPEVPTKRAHVASWELANGPVPKGLVVCHRCDVCLCVNPRHLFTAPQSQNNTDRCQKGRNADRHGERNPNRRLTAEQVAEIRRRYAAGERQIALAEAFGVKQPQISRIVLRQSW